MTFAEVFNDDCLAVLPKLAESSVDAVVTDPPYGLAFMGKTWDHGVPGVPFWTEALRVAKPGAHLVAFGGTRTFHRLTCAIEDAGWEIRDCLSWLYGSGFPKSLDVSKAIDKTEGHWRDRANGLASGNAAMSGPNYERTDKGAPITDAARQWDGWGTALKPAWEPIVLARKPLAGTVAANVQSHGTGALNIDGCRIGDGPAGWRAAPSSGFSGGLDSREEGGRPVAGRWPANVVLDEDAAQLLDEQSGTLTSGANPTRRGSNKFATTYGAFAGEAECVPARGADTGGASRFFYCAKASRAERNEGLDHVALRQRDVTRDPAAPGGNNPRNRGAKAVQNHHPTVKPIALMQWLVRLVTPRGGLVLDPFCGSGSTGIAALREGAHFLGIEREAEYVEIARARLAAEAPLFAQDGAA